MTLPNCPECHSSYVYEDQHFLVCPECGHEFSKEAEDVNEVEDVTVVKDVNGNPLATGDTVTVIKDLKVKGSSTAIKKGTTVKNIRLLEFPMNGHDIDCKIDGFGAMQLKSEFVKKI